MRFVSFLCAAIGAFAATPGQWAASVPIRFEPNRGQVGTTAKDPVLWMARGLDYTFLFTNQGAILNLAGQAIRLRLAGADSDAPYAAGGSATGSIGYLTANLRASVPTHSRLRRSGVYPGVDVIYYGNGEHLEYDFEVAPGADPSRIRLTFEGAAGVRVSETGDLIIPAGSRTLTQRAPVAYQVGPSGKRSVVEAAYRMLADGSVSFTLGAYDRAARLVIDPEFVYTRYLAGTVTDTAIAVTHDNSGFVYLAGNTNSTDFTLPEGKYYFNVNSGLQDVWVMKLNPRATDEASRVPYTTYLGEQSNETLRGLAVDSATGFIYLTGSTTSPTMFPKSGFQTDSKGGTDAFLAVLDPTKSLIDTIVHYTFFGGSGTDDARGVAVFNGKAYIAGSTSSTDLPTRNPIQSSLVGGAEIFVAEFDPTKSGDAALLFSTYVVGGRNDYGRAIAVDPQGKVWIAGVTYSPLPVTSGAFQENATDSGRGFLLKLDLEQKSVLYGTYLGGSSYDEIKKIFLEPSGRVAVTGYTMSSDFPVTQNAYQPQLNGVANAFLTILDPSKPGLDALAYSTMFGGSVGEVAYDLAGDITGKYYLVGYTLSADLPVTNDAMSQTSALGSTDGFLAVLDPAAPPFQSLIYSTYITSPGSQAAYGVDVDISNTAFVVGAASGDVFPAGQATRTTGQGNTDGFFAAWQFPPPPQELIDAFMNQQQAVPEPGSTSGEGSGSQDPTVPDPAPPTSAINWKGWTSASDSTTSQERPMGNGPTTSGAPLSSQQTSVEP